MEKFKIWFFSTMVFFAIFFIIALFWASGDDDLIKQAIIGSLPITTVVSAYIAYSQTELYEQRQEAKNKKKQAEIEKLKQIAKNGVKCPICGSTQIQLVKRGWNIATGMLDSSNVDRMCINCKHKW